MNYPLASTSTFGSAIARNEGVSVRLLVVEDDLAIQEFLRRALIEAGYQVDVAPDARTAESLAAE